MRTLHEHYLTTEDVAHLLHIKPGYLRVRITRGQFPTPDITTPNGSYWETSTVLAHLIQKGDYTHADIPLIHIKRTREKLNLEPLQFTLQDLKRTHNETQLTYTAKATTEYPPHQHPVITFHYKKSYYSTWDETRQKSSQTTLEYNLYIVNDLLMPFTCNEERHLTYTCWLHDTENPTKPYGKTEYTFWDLAQLLNQPIIYIPKEANQRPYFLDHKGKIITNENITPTHKPDAYNELQAALAHHKAVGNHEETPQEFFELLELESKVSITYSNFSSVHEKELECPTLDTEITPENPRHIYLPYTYKTAQWTDQDEARLKELESRFVYDQLVKTPYETALLTLLYESNAFLRIGLPSFLNTGKDRELGIGPTSFFEECEPQQYPTIAHHYMSYGEGFVLDFYAYPSKPRIYAVKTNGGEADTYIYQCLLSLEEYKEPINFDFTHPACPFVQLSTGQWLPFPTNIPTGGNYGQNYFLAAPVAYAMMNGVTVQEAEELFEPWFYSHPGESIIGGKENMIYTASQLQKELNQKIEETIEGK